MEHLPITGAFGIMLGDTFDPSTAISQCKQGEDDSVYEIEPPIPYRSFARYFVEITPTTNLVHGVRGIGTLQPTSAKEELRLLRRILTNRYGPECDRRADEVISEIHRIESDRRSVTLQLSTTPLRPFNHEPQRPSDPRSIRNMIRDQGDQANPEQIENPGDELQVTYCDHDLRQQAMREALDLELEAAAIDATGI